MQRSEQEIQRAVFQHLRQRGAPGIFAFHVPMGGYRRKTEAAIFKGIGAVAGLPDVMILKPAPSGLLLATWVYALELKTEKGVVSGAQDKALRQLAAAGAVTGVAYGLDEALRWLERHGLLRGKVA